MKLDKMCLFPCINFLGKKIKPLLESRYWLLLMLLVVVLLYLPAMFTGFFGDDNWHRLEFSSKEVQKLNLDAAEIQKGSHNLYAFSGFDAKRIKAFKDKGIYPWWMDEETKINFFRPLSSLILALDYVLWPDSPLLMHIHSLLWFLLLVVLVSRLYRQIFSHPSIAGLALLLFAIDDVHAGVSWICNRHGVMAMVFGVLALLFYMQAERKRLFLFLAYMAISLSLLASEMGSITVVYIFVYTVFIDKRQLKVRVYTFLPVLIICLAWVFVRSYLGYGVTGNLLYLDPLKTPGDFLLNLPVRFCLLLFSVCGVPLADMFMLFSPAGAAVAALVALGCLCLSFMLIRFLFKQNRLALFWGIGLLFSLLPLASGLPRNTILGFPGLGMMGLAALLIYRISKAQKQDFKLLQRLGLKALIPPLLICYVIIAPFWTLMLPATFRTSLAVQARLTDFEKAADVSGQCIVIINPPAVSAMEAGLMMRLFSGKPFPASLRYLSSGSGRVTLKRLDINTLQVTPELPFPLFPEAVRDEKSGRVSHFHFEILNRWTDSFYYNFRNPPRPGTQIRLSGVKITIEEVTVDGRIASVMFLFDEPPDASVYTWLEWDKQKQVYIKTRLPEPGETLVY